MQTKRPRGMSIQFEKALTRHIMSGIMKNGPFLSENTDCRAVIIRDKRVLQALSSQVATILVHIKRRWIIRLIIGTRISTSNSLENESVL